MQFVLLTAPRPQRDECVLVIWSNALDTIIPTCHDFQSKLNTLVIRPLHSPFTPASERGDPLADQNNPDAPAEPTAPPHEKSIFDTSPAAKKDVKGRGWWGSGKVRGGTGVKEAEDAEKELEGGVKPWKTQLLASLYGGLVVALLICECAV